VALLACLREIGLHVIGIRGALEILQVTRHARRVRQVVIVVDMARRARRSRVRSRQRKP